MPAKSCLGFLKISLDIESFNHIFIDNSILKCVKIPWTHVLDRK